MKNCLVVILMILCGCEAWSQDSATEQTADTTSPHRSSTPLVARPRPADNFAFRDSVRLADSTHRADSLLAASDLRPTISAFRLRLDTPFFAHHPYFRFTDPIRYSITIRKWRGKEAIFYSIIALLIFFALLRNGFARYLQDLIKTFFGANVKHKQVKEQLLQNPLPSLLLNLFFTLSVGMFLALLLQYFKLGLEFNFWLLYLYCTLGLISIYTLKYVSLKFLGWIFQVSESTDAYIFIVFTTNKIIGMAVLPLLVLIAFTGGMVYQATMSLSIMLVLGLLVYRFFLSFISVRRQIDIGFFHFLLYLLAFELIPLLLINKLLFSFLGETS